MSLPIFVFTVQVLLMSWIQNQDPLPSSDSAAVRLAVAMPGAFFLANAATGAIEFIAIVLSSCADVVEAGPSRAVAFGMVVALFLLGFAFAPLVSTLVGDHVKSVLFASFLGAFVLPIFTVFFVPETVTASAAYQVKMKLAAEAASYEPNGTWLQTLLEPFKCMKVLVRSSLFKYLTLLLVFCTMAQEAAQTLLLYYVVAPPLNFTDRDSAVLLIVVGLTGVFCQAVLLKPLVSATEKVLPLNCCH